LEKAKKVIFSRPSGSDYSTGRVIVILVYYWADAESNSYQHRERERSTSKVGVFFHLSLCC